jgi:hypothetical protein
MVVIGKFRPEVFISIFLRYYPDLKKGVLYYIFTSFPTLNITVGKNAKRGKELKKQRAKNFLVIHYCNSQK